MNELAIILKNLFMLKDGDYNIKVGLCQFQEKNSDCLNVEKKDTKKSLRLSDLMRKPQL